MPPFKLPHGYSFTPPADHPSVLIGGERLYGGADVSDAWDSEGTHWTFCNATFAGLFRFRAFAQKQGETGYTERTLPDTNVDGRGNADVQWYDGRAHYSAWQGAQFYQNAVPGFVPFPSIPSLQAQIDALKGGAVGGTPAPRAPIPIPADGPIAALWHGVYTAAEFDTAPEIALRVGKLLNAVNELVGLLKAAGVLI